MPNSRYKITRAIPGNILAGILAVEALAGQHVSVADNTIASGNTSAAQNPLFELSTGKRGFLLERNVVATRTLESLIFQDEDILSPVITGHAVSAREVQEAEFEGEDYIVLTGGQAIGTGTPINSLLTLAGGKLALRTSAEVEKQAAGHNGAGAVAVAGAQVGDKVRAATNLTDNTDATASFEAVVSVAGQVQQTSATDLSAKQILFNLETPDTSQAAVARLTSKLAPEDPDNNDFAILVEYLH